MSNQENKTAKKSAGKVIFRTLVIIILLLAIAYGCFAWFTPKMLGKVYDSMGIYWGYTRYYEQSYNKTQNYEDLYNDIIVRFDAESDSFRVKNYTTIFINDPEFDDFCAKEDAKNVNDSIRTYDFVVGQLCTAIEFYAGPWQCADACTRYVKENGEYGDHNPFNYVLTYKGDISESQKEVIKAGIKKLLPSLSAEELVFAQRDLAL